MWTQGGGYLTTTLSVPHDILSFGSHVRILFSEILELFSFFNMYELVMWKHLSIEMDLAKSAFIKGRGVEIFS